MEHPDSVITKILDHILKNKSDFHQFDELQKRRTQM